jgi:hypothetical protein
MRGPGGQAIPAVCRGLNESLDKTIEGSVRVDFGPASTYIQFRNPTVTLRRWLQMHNYSSPHFAGIGGVSSSDVGWVNSREEAIISHLDPTQLANLRRNADWQAQVWARFVPVIGEALAGNAAANNSSILVGSPGWHIFEAVDAVTRLAQRYAQQLAAAGCNPNSPVAIARSEMSSLLARMKMSCPGWSSLMRTQQVAALSALLYPQPFNPYGDSPGLELGQSRRIADLVTQLNAYCLGQAVQAQNTPAPLAKGKPGGQVATPEPIVFTSKNYLVGAAVGTVVGATVGALVMHMSMRKKSKSRK